MDRRDSLKSLLVGSLAGGLVINGCAPGKEEPAVAVKEDEKHYGRTDKEKVRDAKLLSEQFFSEHELSTIADLCDLILPANAEHGGAVDAGVPEFVEFIVKDMPKHQLPIRGGLMWLDNHSNKKFKLEFKALSSDQQKEILDEIAYPKTASIEVKQGVDFFSLMRNLTLTGYYTTEMGIKDIGYAGNVPNVWDGVPEEVLQKHNMKYDEDWLPKFMDPDTRNDVAQWDDDGNLIA
ncbi:MAG: gluconate 2-dehydrogenase subunit 3 family protein [Cyclobacteriaceae bacterium]